MTKRGGALSRQAINDLEHERAELCGDRLERIDDIRHKLQEVSEGRGDRLTSKRAVVRECPYDRRGYAEICYELNLSLVEALRSAILIERDADRGRCYGQRGGNQRVMFVLYVEIVKCSERNVATFVRLQSSNLLLRCIRGSVEVLCPDHVVQFGLAVAEGKVDAIRIGAILVNQLDGHEVERGPHVV